MCNKLALEDVSIYSSYYVSSGFKKKKAGQATPTNNISDYMATRTNLPIIKQHKQIISS